MSCWWPCCGVGVEFFTVARIDKTNGDILWSHNIGSTNSVGAGPTSSPTQLSLTTIPVSITDGTYIYHAGHTYEQPILEEYNTRIVCLDEDGVIIWLTDDETPGDGTANIHKQFAQDSTHLWLLSGGTLRKIRKSDGFIEWRYFYNENANGGLHSLGLNTSTGQTVFCIPGVSSLAAGYFSYDTSGSLVWQSPTDGWSATSVVFNSSSFHGFGGYAFASGYVGTHWQEFNASSPFTITNTFSLSGGLNDYMVAAQYDSGGDIVGGNWGGAGYQVEQLVKWNSAGTEQWTADGSDIDTGVSYNIASVDIDAGDSDEVYLCSSTTHDYPGLDPGLKPLVVARYDNNGNYVWHKRISLGAIEVGLPATYPAGTTISVSGDILVVSAREARLFTG